MITPSEFFAVPTGVRVMDAPGGGVFLVTERGSQHTASPLVSAVLSKANGAREAQEIVADLSDFPPAQVLYALSRLQAQGVLESRPEVWPPAQGEGGLCEAVGSLRVRSDNAAALSVMRAALDAAEGPELAPVTLILCSDYLGPLSAEFAVQQVPWLPVKLVGQRSYFGPLFGSGHDACPVCLLRRLRLNRPVETYLAQQGGTKTGHPYPERMELAECAAATAVAAIDVLRDGRASLSGLLEIGPEGRRVHEFSCTCNHAPRPELDLRDETPVSRRLGGYRSRDVGDVVASLHPLVSDLTGLISSAGSLDTSDPTSAGSQARHVWAVSYPIIPRAKAPDPDAFHGVALGKGLTDAQAQASALCEAVERMSAQFPEGFETRRASFEALGDAAVHPNAVWQFSAAQYRDRAKWNALSRDDRRHVPEVFAEDRALDWVPVWSVSQERPKWMLRELCFANAPEPRFGRFDPNGCAAGSTLAEAAVQAFLELVERDSTAIWWYNRIPRPALDPRRVADPRVRELAQGFVDQGWDCWLLDLTGDLTIPCLAAVARAKSDGRWCIGFGCHFESAIAIERAMTELVQLFRANGRDGPPPWACMADADETFLFPQGEAVLEDAPTRSVATLGGLIDWTTDRLRERGIEMLILNQTRPDTMLPVVKVFAPGLRHFWPRFGPGRLYDVPVQMGWRDTPLTEADLNPTHLFL
ncbi:TOMM precursor leader peptide-binding protein [Sedimentitalea todarodis]|uniref:TOMM leader peptide-binding protein n=1 Tax=Sedimentitalea todarodis TaxID=1631240 RepID=A0ABU3V9Q9_9RHOB|nr:TOMM precursor leader peptide-binding protein [Sedimentitalea todarodis]MDU9002900.1 TOMM precursor leader peptide-binding protein [Sedimentitalea todarodis]